MLSDPEVLNSVGPDELDALRNFEDDIRVPDDASDGEEAAEQAADLSDDIRAEGEASEDPIPSDAQGDPVDPTPAEDSEAVAGAVVVQDGQVGCLALLRLKYAIKAGHD